MLLLQLRRRKPLCVVSVQLCICYILNQINYIFLRRAFRSEGDVEIAEDL